MKRDTTIDLIKGSLIIAVVLGHSLQFGFGPEYRNSESFYDDYLFRAIYTFHMPLFMFISGFLFYYSNIKYYKTVLLKKLKSIGIPFISYFIIIYVLIFYYSHADTFYMIDFLNKMRVNMWFLSSLLLNCIIVSSVSHLLNKNKVLIFCLFLLLFFHFIPDEVVPATHKYIFLFFITGYWCGQKNSFFLIRYSKLMAIVLTVIFLISLFFYNKNMFIYGSGLCVVMNRNISLSQILIDIIRYIIGIMDGMWYCCVMSLLGECRWFKSVKAFLVNIGMHTLAIYGFQSVFFVLLTEYLERYNICIPYNYLTPIVLTIIVLGLSECFIKICNYTKYGRVLFLGRK